MAFQLGALRAALADAGAKPELAERAAEEIASLRPRPGRHARQLAAPAIDGGREYCRQGGDRHPSRLWALASAMAAAASRRKSRRAVMRTGTPRGAERAPASQRPSSRPADG